jgi:hypothetical protein
MKAPEDAIAGGYFQGFTEETISQHLNMSWKGISRHQDLPQNRIRRRCPPSIDL